MWKILKKAGWAEAKMAESLKSQTEHFAERSANWFCTTFVSQIFFLTEHKVASLFKLFRFIQKCQICQSLKVYPIFLPRRKTFSLLDKYDVAAVDPSSKLPLSNWSTAVSTMLVLTFLLISTKPVYWSTCSTPAPFLFMASLSLSSQTNYTFFDS